MLSCVMSAFASSPAFLPSRSTTTRSATALHLGQPVRDVQDRDAGRFQAVDHLVEPFGLLSASGWRSARP